MIGESLSYASGVLLIVGALFSVLGAVGLLRFPDLYTRLHAASLTGTVGLGNVFLALALAAPDWAIATRAIVGVAFVLLTGPVIGHLLARAARRSGVSPSRETSIHDRDGRP
ncbi:MAG: monovalent cation/H(+) antiporter subunit G [Devosia sp.]